MALNPFTITSALKKYQNANAVSLRSMSEWLGVLEHSNAKQRKKMSHSLILFAGKSLERQGILPKNGLRNAIILIGRYLRQILLY